MSEPYFDDTWARRHEALAAVETVIKDHETAVKVLVALDAAYFDLITRRVGVRFTGYRTRS